MCGSHAFEQTYVGCRTDVCYKPRQDIKTKTSSLRKITLHSSLGLCVCVVCQQLDAWGGAFGRVVSETVQHQPPILAAQARTGVPPHSNVFLKEWEDKATDRYRWCVFTSTKHTALDQHRKATPPWEKKKFPHALLSRRPYSRRDTLPRSLARQRTSLSPPATVNTAGGSPPAPRLFSLELLQSCRSDR